MSLSECCDFFGNPGPNFLSAFLSNGLNCIKNIFKAWFKLHVYETTELSILTGLIIANRIDIIFHIINAWYIFVNHLFL